jgi:hypothetical protein
MKAIRYQLRLEKMYNKRFFFCHNIPASFATSEVPMGNGQCGIVLLCQKQDTILRMVLVTKAHFSNKYYSPGVANACVF